MFSKSHGNTRKEAVVIPPKNIIKSKHTDTNRHENIQKKTGGYKTMNSGSTKQPGNKIAIVCPGLSIVTLNVNSPIMT